MHLSLFCNTYYQFLFQLNFEKITIYTVISTFDSPNDPRSQLLQIKEVLQQYICSNNCVVPDLIGKLRPQY